VDDFADPGDGGRRIADALWQYWTAASVVAASDGLVDEGAQHPAQGCRPAGAAEGRGGARPGVEGLTGDHPGPVDVVRKQELA
jgi:hypothetical protein